MLQNHKVTIHPMSVVDDSVTIGNGTKIWQFATVIRNTVLGKDCVVAAGACLDGPVFGDRCIISPGVDIGPGFIIGDDVFIGPHVVLCNDFWPRTHKENFDYESLRSGKVICVRIGSGTSIGANAVLMPGITIGKNCMIAANSVVNKSVPDNFIFKLTGEIRFIDNEHKIERIREC